MKMRTGSCVLFRGNFMCGFVAVCAYADDLSVVNQSELLAARDQMCVRGPDGCGAWFSDDGRIGLGHRRLAIIDTSDDGLQPMTSADGLVQLVFNGEIYNHPELRAWCEAHGANYVSNTDTETLLHLYALEGEGFVRRLRGMFAFALWDGGNETLLLARDPFGIKPLYYADDGHQVWFASQVKALIRSGVDNQISPAGVVSFFLWGYVTEPHTWYRSVQAVPAGSITKIRSDGRKITTVYHDPLDVLRGDTSVFPKSVSLREAVLDSVKHHLLADVPVSLFLSAGIDSGTLCALVRECVGSARIRGVTLGFDEYAGSVCDEVPLASIVAQRYGCNHDVVTYGREDFECERDRLIAAMDQPTVDGVNTYFVSKATAAAGFKVALSGVGGDEIFGGYPSFRQIPRLVRALRPIPRGLGKGIRAVIAPVISKLASPKYAGLAEYGGSVAGAYLLRRALFMPWEISALVGEDLAVEGLRELDVIAYLEKFIQGVGLPYDQIMALEYSVYLKNCLLRDADWAGMAHSLEIRTPLVDAMLFEQVITLRRANPKCPHTKLDWAQTPRLPLPAELQNRAKSGFDFPIREWLMSGGNLVGKDRGRRGWARSLISTAEFGNADFLVGDIECK